MKPNLLVIALTLAALVTLRQPVAAAETKPKDIDNILTDQRLRSMSTKLSLSEEQKTKLRPILFEEVKGVRAVRADEKLSWDEKFAKEEVISKGCLEKAKGILTPEQFQKWNEFRKQQKHVHPPHKE